MTFKQYLINVGIRSHEFKYSDEILFEHVEYFKNCYNNRLSSYKALLFLEFHISDLNEKKNP